MSDLAWNEEECKKCGEECVGEDMGDREDYLSFDCECGHRWDSDCTEGYASMMYDIGKSMRKYGE